MLEGSEILRIAGRTVLVYLSLLLVVRVLGKRTVGSVTAFDLIVALILGEVADEMIFGNVPMIEGLAAIGSVGLLHFGNSYISFRSTAVDRLTGGSPRTLIQDGRIVERALAEERINEEELRSLLRLEGVEDPREVRRATLEPDGKLSVLR